MPRVRQKRSSGITGQYIFPGFSTTRATVARVSQCSDEFGVRDNNFSVYHAYVRNPVFSFENPGASKKFINFCPSSWATPGRLAMMSDPSRPGNAALAVSVISKTNPSKSRIDLPISIAELRELPDLVRSAGRSLISRIGENNLRYYFGVKPIVDDLIKLIEFKRSVENRMKLLKKFRDEGPMLRKVPLYSGSVENFPGTKGTYNSTPYGSNIDYILKSRRTVRKVWGYTTWTPADTFYKLMSDDAEIERRAYEIILGLRIDFVTLWEALPWSWLADWFGNVGDWLSANRHVVPITPSLPRICETAWVEYQLVSDSNGFGMPKGAHQVTLVTKHISRSLQSASLPSASLPLLTPGQALILPSVAAVKGRL